MLERIGKGVGERRKRTSSHRYNIRHYIARWDPVGAEWIKTKLETKMTPPIPILLDKTCLWQLAQHELLCPTVFLVNEPLMTKHCGPRLLVPVLHPNSGYQMTIPPLMWMGHPYGCTLTTHVGYILMVDRSVALVHFRTKKFDHMLWYNCMMQHERKQLGRQHILDSESRYLQPRPRNILMHILTQQVLEMTSHSMPGKTDEVVYPLESIWWHPVFNLSDEEWDSLVYWLPIDPKDKSRRVYNAEE